MRASWVIVAGALVVGSVSVGGCSSSSPAKPQSCVDLCACSSSNCNMTKEEECKPALSLLQTLGQCPGSADGGADSGGGRADGGGGGSDGGGGGGADCMAMSACCAKLPEPNKTKCTDIVDKGESYCQNYKDNYCSLDPAACTKLEACCATLSGTDKSTCDLQVSTYSGDVEQCGIALKQYPSCN